MDGDQPQTAPGDIDGRDPWPADAPVDLIYLHDRTGRRDHRALLCRLLKAPTMSRAWRRLDKRIKSGNLPSHEAYQRLWGAINYSLVQAKRNSGPRGKHSYDDEKRERGRKVAQEASKLKRLLVDGPFDLCAHELYPSEVIELSSVVSFQESSSGPQSQRNLVHRESLEWTTISEILNALAGRARKEADRPPIVGKWTPESESNYFIRTLADHFYHYFDGPMATTLAAIATVALDRDDANALTEEGVKRALRWRKRGDKRAK